MKSPSHSCRRLSKIALAAGACLGLWAPLARAVVYTYAGPYSGTGAAANLWSTVAWLGGTPVSGPNTQLVFNNFDSNVYSANNDLGTPFAINSLTVHSWSTTVATLSSAAGKSLQLTGASPSVTLDGPGGTSIGGGGNGLVLAPTSGSTTLGGSGAGTLTFGNNSTVISGNGGVAVNFTGAGGTSFFGANTYTGGVTLNAGILRIGGNTALGDAANVLTVNGGEVRTSGVVTVGNNAVLNNTLLFSGGTMTMNGALSGSGGLRLVNGVNFQSQTLTLTGASTFAGPLTIDNSLGRAFNPVNVATLTLAAGASLATPQAITVGSNGTLSLVGNGANTRINDTAPIVLNGGRLSISGSTGGSFSETLGATSISGQAVITLASAADTTALAFGNLSRQNNATVFLRGAWNGVNNVLTFASGMTAVSDPLAPSTSGQYTAIVPFATGNNLAANINAATRVTYSAATGVGYISPLDSTRVYQLSGGANFDASTDYKNVNLTDTEAVADARRINSLSTTSAGSLSGTGTLTIYSGAVQIVGGNASPVLVNGPTLEFGANTAYFHLGGNLSIVGSSNLSGSGGVVVSGLDSLLTPAGNGSGGGYSVQFSNTANTFGGGLFIQGNASVNFTNDAQLGAAGGAVMLEGGGLTFNSASSTLTTKRQLILGAAGGSLATVGGSTFNVGGLISGSGPLTIGSGGSGAGPVVLSGTNTYTGPTFLTPGATLIVSNDGNLGSTAATLNLNGGTLQFAAGGSFNRTFNFYGAGVNIDTNGNAVTLAGPLTGLVPGGFNKVGAGTLTLAAASPLYAGQLFVNGGTLALAAGGALPQVTILTVNSGATLAGNGMLGGTAKVLAGGSLAPSNGAGGATGVLTVGRLGFASGATYAVDLLGIAAGTQYDQISVTGIGSGSVALGGATLALNLGFTPVVGSSFMIINNQSSGDAVAGIFNGLAEGASFTASGTAFNISYLGGDGNDVVLTAAAVPEPATTLLWLSGCGALWLRRRTLRQRSLSSA